ncbi:MAG: GNAT family N-acetyltransferase [Clostridia bacterium]|nr:GNAT family N-acetyltransferase [Clostridia bacterium]
MIKLIAFNEKDIDVLTPIMKSAFDEDSHIHLNGQDGGPDGYDNGDFLRKWFMHPRAVPYTIYLDGQVIGAVNLWINTATQDNRLGCLFISPEYENKGIGRQVWTDIERMYPDTHCWYTETPVFSQRNHNFYINKCGFHCIRIDNPKDYMNGQFILRKTMK